MKVFSQPSNATILMANLANRISFKADDPESAHILSEIFGKKQVFRGKVNGIAHYEEVPSFLKHSSISKSFMPLSILSKPVSIRSGRCHYECLKYIFKQSINPKNSLELIFFELF